MRRLLLAVPLLALLVVGCGDGADGVVDENSQSTRGVAGGPAPILDGPASRYAPPIEEMPEWLLLYPPDTYAITAEVFARLGAFESPAQGEEFALNQGFEDGWQVRFEPDGLLAGVVEGRFYATVQVFRFQRPSGAGAAFDQYESAAEDIAGSQEVEVAALGNQSAGWRYIEGTVGDTEVVAVYHRFVFQRGNLLTVVQTYGAEPVMTIDQARELAAVVDERALADPAPPEPTPIVPSQGG